MITTSYIGKGFKKLIAGLVEICDPKTIVELGTQQGASAILMAKAMGEGHLYTYDLFEKRYPKPPYAPTRADFIMAQKNIAANKLQKKITIRKKDAFWAYKDFKKVDILHIDLCNYNENVRLVLSKWYTKVNKLILLEGGIINKWQREKRFKPFDRVLNMPFIKNNYEKIVIKKDNNYALTILIRK